MESGRLTDASDRAAAQERLSALIDGELGDADVVHACAQWRADAELRVAWHAYQMIGDVLRSDDLCSAPGHDAAFLAALRGRLSDEPVVLAPQAAGVAAASGIAGRRAWRTPAAVAAGFIAVVGVVVATRVTAPAPEAPVLAKSAGEPAQVAASVDTSAGDLRGGVASGQLIHDARLDRYLSAHKQFAGSSALGVPSGFLRNATADASDR